MSKDVIARRTFTIGCADGREIELLIYAPVADGDDFRCDYEIIGDDEVATCFHGMDVDSLQALILTLQMAGASLTFSDRAKNRELYWVGQNDDLGLLLPRGCEDSTE